MNLEFQMSKEKVTMSQSEVAPPSDQTNAVEFQESHTVFIDGVQYAPIDGQVVQPPPPYSNIDVHIPTKTAQPTKSRFETEQLASREREEEQQKRHYINWFWCGFFCPGWTGHHLGNRIGSKSNCCCTAFPTIIMFFLWTGFLFWIVIILCGTDCALPGVNKALQFFGDISGFVFCLSIVSIFLMMTWRLTYNVRLRRKYVDRSRKEESPLRSLYMMACCRPCAYGEIGALVESNQANSINSTRQFEYIEM